MNDVRYPRKWPYKTDYDRYDRYFDFLSQFPDSVEIAWTSESAYNEMFCEDCGMILKKDEYTVCRKCWERGYGCEYPNRDD